MTSLEIRRVLHNWVNRDDFDFEDYAFPELEDNHSLSRILTGITRDAGRKLFEELCAKDVLWGVAFLAFQLGLLAAIEVERNRVNLPNAS